MRLLDQFREVDPQMLWHAAAKDQFDKFEAMYDALCAKFPVTSEIVGKHRSKSINLPVIRLRTDAGDFTLRNNFYDTNLMANLREPTTLSLEQFFAGIQEPLSWEWYLSEIAKARGYSWNSWTSEEMDDPRILRVWDPDRNMWWEKKGAEKDRWKARLSSPEWYANDWSSSELTWDGDFGPGVKLFRQHRAFAEGIDVKASTESRYAQGTHDFIIATDSLDSAAMMIERLIGGA